MIKIEVSRDESGQKVVRTNLSGRALLGCPVLSKGTAFDRQERAELGLTGLLPYHVRTLEEQVFWAYEEFKQKTSDIERHIYLRALQDNIEIVFYRLLYRAHRGDDAARLYADRRRCLPTLQQDLPERDGG